MLAKLARELPEGEGLFYEPKWDGFRCIVFRDGDDVVLGSRNEKPLTRYFPELVESLRANVPDRCVLDGEIVIAGPSGLDFDALSQRIHPAESRIELLARTTPASFVAFDLLALGDADLRSEPYADRRRALEEALEGAQPPVHLTPVTDPAGCGPGLVLAVRRSRPGRRRREGRRSPLPARQAGDDEGQARADRRLRGRWIPVAQVGPGGRAPSSSGSSTMRACSTTSGVASGFSAARREEFVEVLEPLPERRIVAPPLAQRRRARGTGPRWPEPMERGQGPQLGAACGPSWSPRWPTTTSRSTGSGMPPRSSAGAPTGPLSPAPTRSSTPRCPPSSTTSSAAVS